MACDMQPERAWGREKVLGRYCVYDLPDRFLVAPGLPRQRVVQRADALRGDCRNAAWLAGEGSTAGGLALSGYARSDGVSDLPGP